jgi:hypothetical protein
MVASTRRPAPPDHRISSPTQEVSDAVQEGEGPQEVGGWSEAGQVAFMLIFYMVVIGLATHPEIFR